jgi:hypothetical protein
MHKQPHTLTLPDLLHELQLTEITFRRRRAAMEAAGFPRMLPGLGNRWSRRAVLAWINQSATVTHGNDNAVIGHVLIANATSWLEQRIGE